MVTDVLILTHYLSKGNKKGEEHLSYFLMGHPGLEPGTSALSTQRSNQLS